MKSQEARQYGEAVGNLCLAAGLVPFSGDVSVELFVYRPRRSGDLDNYIKVTLDSLNRRAYLDDKQVVRIEATRLDDKLNPRVVVVVEEV